MTEGWGGGWGGWGRVRNGGLLEKIDNDILLTGQEQPRLKRFILISMYILHDKGPYEGKFVEKGGLRKRRGGEASDRLIIHSIHPIRP